MLEIAPQLSLLGRTYQASRIVLFGSRARGDASERSDIDLAAFDVPAEQQASFRLALDDLPTLLNFDLVFVQQDTNPVLLSEIERDGVIIYDASESKA